jgi:hypothetical protein
MGKYDGMTTNERLFAADLLYAFENAWRARNRPQMIEILRQVELAEQAERIVDTMLGNPEAYRAPRDRTVR